MLLVTYYQLIDMNILIVEDENSIREVEAAYLKKNGYNIIEADTGRKALDLFQKNDIDLIILDINIPEIDGITVCRKIRETSTIPIIMVTARVQDIDELIGLECGADDYVKKPFNPAILVARVKTLFKRLSGTKFENEAISIDPEKMNVIVKDKKIDLTTTEFNILYTMAKSPGKVFTRYEIIDKAYDGGLSPDILDRTVDVHIKNLRKKMDVEPGLPEFILTVIGKGYKFNDEIK
jgi:two-component system alkaline phosphatase synthesis response regulator PhoP